MSRRPLLPLNDYRRIYQVAFSVLEASRMATTHRACIFFASAGTMILREHYGRAATISAGTLALMTDERQSTVLFYGRNDDGLLSSDRTAFHAWVECDGWLLDFMAPIMGVAFREDGKGDAPRRMLQKPLDQRCGSPAEIQRQGDYFIAHDATLTSELLDRQPPAYFDLLNVCTTWYRRPPKALRDDMAMRDERGQSFHVKLHAPSIDGIW